MLTILFSLICFTSFTFAANQNNVSSNYVIWQFSSTYFPYAVGVCQPAGLTESTGYLFTCSDTKDYVTLEVHSDTTCSDANPNTGIINSTYFGYNTSIYPYSTYPGAFNCHGDDEYTQIEFHIGECTKSNPTIINAAIDVCTRINSTVLGGYGWLYIYCQDDKAEMQYYNNSLCANVDPYETNYAISDCGHLFDFSGIGIYGEVLECTECSTADICTYYDTTETPSSATIIIPFFTILTFIFALLK